MMPTSTSSVSLTSSDTPYFYVRIPKALAAGMRKSIKGAPQGTTRPVGVVVSKEPFVPGTKDKFIMNLKCKLDSKTQQFIMKGDPSKRSERILVHDRTVQDQYRHRSRQEESLLPQKRTPDQISFNGYISHNCTVVPDPRDKVSLLEMGKRLEAKRQKKIAESSRRKAKSVSVREQPRPERNQGMVKVMASSSSSSGSSSSSSSSSSSLTATQLSRQEGMREQYEVKLQDSVLRSILIKHFREKEASFVPNTKFSEFSGLKLKNDIMTHTQLQHQKETWVKNVLNEIADYHTEAGNSHQRWSLKASLK